MSGWIIWFVGLPGSGKSTLAKAVVDYLQKHLEQEVIYLEMDAQRKKYFPQPRYTKEEREQAYLLFAQEAMELAREGKGVVMDGAAYKRKFRDYVRNNFSRFAEIYVKCSLPTAMEREASRPAGKVMADLYQKALIRKRTGKQFAGLGEVIGVDVDFEENPQAELILVNDHLRVDEAKNQVIQFVRTWLNSK